MSQQHFEIDKYERRYLIAAVALVGVFFAALLAGAFALNVHPPDAAEFVNPLTLGQTEFTNLGMMERSPGVYDAYILAQMWQFNLGPDAELDEAGFQVMRVPLNARVTFHVASRDVNHGFFVQYHNVNLQLVPGHIARQSTTFDRPGTYWVECHEYCGRGHHAMGFKIIVEEAAS